MRFAIGVDYIGHAFVGLQAQTGQKTVQGVLEQAISQVADHPVTIFAAGRTDKGVHATEMVFHFESSSARQNHGWLMGVNANLPPELRVLWVEQVENSFDARRSAFARTYHYYIYTGHKQALLGGLVTNHYLPLDADKMHMAAQALLGEHDFSGYRAAECQAPTANRCIHAIDVAHIGQFIRIRVTANAFLHHMVRNIVGTLLPVGRGDKSVNYPGAVLACKDRRRGGITAAADGLYLVKVHYPFELPQINKAPFFDAEPLLGLKELGILETPENEVTHELV